MERLKALHRNSQSGQALAAVLVIMTLVFLLAGGTTMAIAALVQQQGPDRSQTFNDLTAQNAVAVTAADIAGGSDCGVPGPSSTLLVAPPFGNDWGLPVYDSANPPVGLSDNGPAGLVYTPSPGSSSESFATDSSVSSQTWSGYTVIARFSFPGGMSPGTRVELDAGVQLAGAASYVALEQPTLGQPQWEVGSAGGTANASTLRPQSSVRSVTLELDGVGGLITGSVSGAWNPAPTILSASTLTGTVRVAVTSSATVDVTSVEVDRGIPAPTDLSPISVPQTSGYHCQRLDQVAPAGSLAQRRVGSAAQPGCPSQVSSGALLTSRPGDQWKLWFTVAWPKGTQAQPLRLDLAASNSWCPYSSSGTSQAHCGNQQSTTWDGSLTAVAAACTIPPSGNQGSYWLYLTAVSGEKPAAPNNLPSYIDLHWAATGSDSMYMTVASVPGGHEESDLLLDAGSVALTYEGALG